MRLLGLKKLWYSNDKVRYKHFARKYDTAVKEFIVSQENNVLKKKSLSCIFQFICKFQAYYISQCIPPLIDSNDNLVVSNRKCTVLNDYFASVFTADDGLLPEFVPRLSENKYVFSSHLTRFLRLKNHCPQNVLKLLMGFPLFS